MATGEARNGDLKASKLFDVHNYCAVVTGGDTGIGLMITQTLVANGTRVYITGRRKDALETVLKKYSTGPGEIIARNSAAGNAGVPRDDNTKYSNSKPDFASAQSISDHLMESDPEACAETFSTNVSSQFFVSAAFLPLLAKANGCLPGFTSSIINITSISGVMKGSSNGQFAYASSKAAFQHLNRMMATMFVETKVRVNSIAPGVFPEITAGESNEHQKSSLDSEASNPRGRYGHDTDMGACVLFLGGPGGQFLNGQVIYPDGGNILMSPACT